MRGSPPCAAVQFSRKPGTGKEQPDINKHNAITRFIFTSLSINAVLAVAFYKGTDELILYIA